MVHGAPIYQALRLIILFFAILCSQAQAQDRIQLTNGEWPPYLSEHLPHQGAASWIVSEAFAAAGVEVTYGFYPWKRSYKLAKEGIWDGTLVWVYTAARAKDFYYSDVVIKEVEHLFHLKETPLVWQRIEDLKGLTIGATLHTAYPPLERAAKAGILKIERAGNYGNLYRRLLNRRIDAIPQVSQVAKHYLNTTLHDRDRERITYAGTILQERAYHLILSRQSQNSERYITLFNKGLSIIRKNGKYQSIIQLLKEDLYFHKKD